MATTQPVHPIAIKLLNRMTCPPADHRRFVGEHIDLTQLDALALGDLWTTAEATYRSVDHHAPKQVAGETALAILMRGKEIEPAFRGSACRDFLDLLIRRSEETPPSLGDMVTSYVWRDVQFVLARCIELDFHGLGPVAQRFLAIARWAAMPHLAVALGRLAGCQTQVLEKLAVELSGSPILVEELNTVATLDLAVSLSLGDIRPSHADGREPASDDALPLIFDDPVYIAFAEKALKQAAERVRRIHDLEVPYGADKAFTLGESAALDRLVRLALARDESWLPPVMDELFRKVSLAPTAAKSMPSQSVAVVIGHAIEAFPTPEAIATLRLVIRDMRHAGVDKKVQRNLRGAERRLADRSAIALRLPIDQPISKTQLTTIVRCLEAGFISGLQLKYEDWLVRLAGHNQAKNLAESIVWRIHNAAGQSLSVLPVITAGQVSLRDVTGGIIAPPSPDSPVTLWHPADATAEERTAWRDRLAALKITQPFKQVFREHYVVPLAELTQTTSEIFFGYAVSVVPFLGLARRERWRDEYDGPTRRFASWTACLALGDNIFPGFVGITQTRALYFTKSVGRTSVPVRLGEVPVVILSEILRAVDLLVSVGSFAIDAGEYYDAARQKRLRYLAEGALSDMTEMRKQALQRILATVPGVVYDARHLRLGRYAVHMSTGRVTHDGDPVTIDLPKRSKLAAVPWLPHDEKLLETIVYSAEEITRRLYS